MIAWVYICTHAHRVAAKHYANTSCGGPTSPPPSVCDTFRNLIAGNGSFWIPVLDWPWRAAPFQLRTPWRKATVGLKLGLQLASTSDKAIRFPLQASASLSHLYKFLVIVAFKKSNFLNTQLPSERFTFRGEAFACWWRAHRALRFPHLSRVSGREHQTTAQYQSPFKENTLGTSWHS